MSDGVRLHKGSGHIMDSKSPGTPKYYHGKGSKYHEIQHKKNPKAGTGKVSPYSVGRSGAKSLLTQSAKGSMAGAGMMYGGVLALLGELMFPKKTASDEQQKKHKKEAGY